MNTLTSRLGKNDLALLLYLSPNQPGEFPAPAVLAADPDAPVLAEFPVLPAGDEAPGLPRTGTPSSSSVLTAVLLESLHRLEDEGTAVPADGGPAWGRELDTVRMAWCQSMIGAVWPDARRVRDDHQPAVPVRAAG